jgi:hypothetical protein
MISTAPMTRRLRRTVGVLACGGLALQSSTAAAQNLTPGTGGGGNHTAYVFAPYRWTDDRGESRYREHVCDGVQKGQRYIYIELDETEAPNVAPHFCTVSMFYFVIHEQSASVGTLLLIRTHNIGHF